MGSVLSGNLRGGMRAGFVAASRPGWWIVAVCGAIGLILALVTTGCLGPADRGPDRQPAVARRRKVTGERAMTSPRPRPHPRRAPPARRGLHRRRESGDVAARAWQCMRALVLDRYDRRKKVCDALGMSFIRAKALRRIVDGPMTMRELAAALGTDPPYTTVVVDDLERRGLVSAPSGPVTGARRSSRSPRTAAQAHLAERILNDPPRPVRELPATDLEALGRILSHLASPEEPGPAS